MRAVDPSARAWHFFAMFVALTQNSLERREAFSAEPKAEYVCPNVKCRRKMIFVNATKRRKHFRHSPNSDCIFRKGESPQHEEAKAVVLDGARSRGLRAAPELEILAIDGDRRADVVIWAPQTDPPKLDDHRRIAIEVQYSSIDEAQLITRTNAYMSAGVPVLWIPVLDRKRLNHIRRIQGTSLYRSSGYCAPIWVRSIAMLHGHVWVYVPGLESFWRGWLLPHWRYKNPKDWFDADGNERSSGGYWFRSERERDLVMEGPYVFTDLGIVRVNETENRLLGKSKSKRFLADLVPLPSASKKVVQPIEYRERPDVVDGAYNGLHDYELWVNRNGEWGVAEFENTDVFDRTNAASP